MTDLELEKLKAYFQTRKEIAFAFLFGSEARGTATRLSDVDIAVYFYPKTSHRIEYEGKEYYESEQEIWREIEQLLKRELELLVLNRTSASVAASAIRGIPLAIHDWGLYLDFMLRVTSAAIDFREMLFQDFLEKEKNARRNIKTASACSVSRKRNRRFQVFPLSGLDDLQYRP